MTGWFRGLARCATAASAGRQGPVAGLGSGVPGTPGAALELMLSTRAPVRFRRAPVTVSPTARRRISRPLAIAFPH